MEEYEAIRWVHPVDILSNSFASSLPTASPHSQPSTATTEFHPALHRASRDLLAMQVWEKIEQLHTRGGGDEEQQRSEEIGSLLSTFILLKGSTPLPTDYLLKFIH